jgi:hypothetical protein
MTLLPGRLIQCVMDDTAGLHLVCRWRQICGWQQALASSVLSTDRANPYVVLSCPTCKCYLLAMCMLFHQLFRVRVPHPKCNVYVVLCALFVFPTVGKAELPLSASPACGGMHPRMQWVHCCCSDFLCLQVVSGLFGRLVLCMLWLATSSVATAHSGNTMLLQATGNHSCRPA